MSNMIRTDGLQLQALGYDLRKPHQSKKARVGIRDLTKTFPDRDAIDGVFSEPEKTMVLGCDPGEIVTAAFCAINPKEPNEVQNLSIKRTALYAPVIAYREELKKRKEEAGIFEIEQALPSLTYESTQKFEEYLQGKLAIMDQLREFYGSTEMKKIGWERTKSKRAEYDWATDGALSMIQNKDESLIVIGNGHFNTHHGLATLHESFKGHFYHQVRFQCPLGLSFLTFPTSRC